MFDRVLQAATVDEVAQSSNVDDSIERDRHARFRSRAWRSRDLLASGDNYAVDRALLLASARVAGLGLGDCEFRQFLPRFLNRYAVNGLDAAVRAWPTRGRRGRSPSRLARPGSPVPAHPPRLLLLSALSERVGPFDHVYCGSPSSSRT
jgi:hypothetical protein